MSEVPLHLDRQAVEVREHPLARPPERGQRSEEGSYLSLIDFVYHSTLGLRVIKRKKKKASVSASGAAGFACPQSYR